MTILANAFPKMGCNLLKKTFGAMGYAHHDGGLIRHNVMEPMRFKVPIEGGGKREEPVERVLGLPNDTFVHAHLCYGGGLPLQDCRMVYIHRNPRDAAISMLRTGKGQLQETKGSLAGLLMQGCFTYGPWLTAWQAFMNWTQAPWVLSCRFDQICSDGGETVQRIADYLGWDGDAQRIYAGLYGNGKQFEGRDVYEGKSTWTGQHSDWEACGYWDDEVEELWSRLGGPEAEKRWGY